MTHPTMTTESTVSPGEETQITTPEVEQPEVTTPEVEPEQSKSEVDPRDKTISKLERRVNRKHAEAAAAAERVRQLEQRLAQFETQQPQQQEQTHQLLTPDQAVRLAEEVAVVREVTRKANAIHAEGTKAHPDFMQAVAALAEEVGPLFNQRGLPSPVMEAILDAEVPAKLLHYLGTNPDEAAQLVGLSAGQIGRRIARMEDKLREAATPKTSSAPKPLEPVKASTSDSELHSGLSDAEWIRRREAQLKSRR